MLFDVRQAFLLLCLTLLSACGDGSKVSSLAATGTQPAAQTPQSVLIPTSYRATSTGWPLGQSPVAALGMQVQAFAEGLNHPRWLQVLPNGDVLVAESNAPDRSQESAGIMGWIASRVMRRTVGVTASANRISLLRDSDNDGIADWNAPLITSLNLPFGMALVGDYLYVANTDALVRFAYQPGRTRITEPGVKLMDLPAGPINHHWTKSLIASPDGSKLYVTVGSNSNVAERGMAVEEGRAAIWEFDIATGTHAVFASGLRNPNGMAWEPHTGALWAAVNERDEWSTDHVPDYMTAVQRGAFYGWPYSYFGQQVDARVKPGNPDLVAKARVPDYALGLHTASLGLASSVGTTLPTQFAQGMFIGQHGSWNRKPHSGYKVVYVPFVDGKPVGPPTDVLTGFLSAEAIAYGRPVGVALDKTGALLVADDAGNIVWRVSAKP